MSILHLTRRREAQGTPGQTDARLEVDSPWESVSPTLTSEFHGNTWVELGVALWESRSPEGLGSHFLFLPSNSDFEKDQ